MVRSFSEKMFDFLNSRYGSLLSHQQMDMAKRQLSLDDIDNSSDYEKIMFVDFITNMLYSEDNREVLNRKKSLIYYKVFGSNMKLPFQPVCFFDFNFGDNFSCDVLNICQKNFGIGDVMNFDENYQITFVRNILSDMFSKYGTAKQSEVRIQFYNYIKSDDHFALDVFKVMMPHKGYNLDSAIDIVESINSFMFTRSGGSFSGINQDNLYLFLDKMQIESYDQKYYAGIIERELKSRHPGYSNSSSDLESISVFNDLKKILAEFVGSQSADSLLKHCMEDLSLDDFSMVNEEKRRLFIDYITSNTFISNYSEQKKNLIKDKLRTVLLS